MIHLIEIKAEAFEGSSVRLVTVDGLPVGWIGKIRDFSDVGTACPAATAYGPDTWMMVVESVSVLDPDAAGQRSETERRFYFGATARGILKKCFAIPALN